MKTNKLIEDLEEIKKYQLIHKRYIVSNTKGEKEAIDTLEEAREFYEKNNIDMKYVKQGSTVFVSYLNISRTRTKK